MSENTFAPISPYYAAKVVNLRLAAEGIVRESEMQGPQMYQYAKNGVITSNYAEHVADKKVKIVLDGNAFKSWLDRYVERLQNGEVRGADIAKLAEQYM
jgi:hypothetical protein